jgi:hypothetical protein
MMIKVHKKALLRHVGAGLFQFCHIRLRTFDLNFGFDFQFHLFPSLFD